MLANGENSLICQSKKSCQKELEIGIVFFKSVRFFFATASIGLSFPLECSATLALSSQVMPLEVATNASFRL